MTDDTQQPLNREQRRAQKFRSKSKARQDNLHTQRENDTGFLATPTDSLADGPNEAAESTPHGATHHVGPGTGGAVESDEGEPHHEGMHLGNQGNS
jgi:hypothetical protein